MILITIRHGESSSNDSGITTGWMDVELTNEGLKQAEKVAERLKDKKIDIIYSSDLERAFRTAEEIAKFHSCKLILDERLREQKKGKYEAGSGKKLWDDFRASREDILEWIPEGGESMGKVKERVMDFLNEIEKKHKNKTVLIVSHGGVLAVISRHFYNDIEFDGKLDNKFGIRHKHKNTSVSQYSFDGTEWNVDIINCTGHLK